MKLVLTYNNREMISFTGSKPASFYRHAISTWSIAIIVMNWSTPQMCINRDCLDSALMLLQCLHSYNDNTSLFFQVHFFVDALIAKNTFGKKGSYKANFEVGSVLLQQKCQHITATDSVSRYQNHEYKCQQRSICSVLFMSFFLSCRLENSTFFKLKIHILVWPVLKLLDLEKKKKVKWSSFAITFPCCFSAAGHSLIQSPCKQE